MRLFWQTLLLATALSLSVPLEAETQGDRGAPLLGDPLLGDTLAVLRINDPRWLEREISTFSAGLGNDPAPLRATFARLLLRCRSFDGIDFGRPILFAWRKGPAPLLAIIPLTDRRAFLGSFGAGLGDDSPLIRIGEREGTEVYSQNGNEGLIEYRLMVSDSSAFLARTPDECRALQAHVPVAGEHDAPLAFAGSSAFLLQLADPLADLAAGYLPSDQLATQVLSDISGRAWRDLLGQIATLGVEASGDEEHGLRLNTRIHALPESSLAAWIGNQRNQPNRLLPLLRGPNAGLTVSGCIAWQGEGQRLADLIAGSIKGRFGTHWNAAADELWRGIWSSIERSGPFATAIDVDFQRGHVQSEWRMVAQQPRANDLVGVANTMVQTLTGVPGEALTLPGSSGFRQPGHALIGGQNGDMITLASDHAVAAVQSTVRDGEQVAAELLQRSDAALPPDGSDDVAATTVYFTPIIRTMVQLAGGAPPAALQPVTAHIDVRCGDGGALVVDGQVQIAHLGLLIRDSGLLQPGGPH